MKYAMLSCLIPREQAEFFKTNTKNTMQDAASALQWNLYDGFCFNLNENIPLFNVLPVNSFPQFYKYPFVMGGKFGGNGNNIGFCNIKLIRNHSKYRKIYKALCNWCKTEHGEKTLFVYTISQPFVKAVLKLKKKYHDLTVCAIVADLPDMSNLSSKKSLLQKLYARVKSSDVYGMLHCIDRFVLLTAQMADYMKITQPYCVMEGIAASAESENENTAEQTETKTVLYTGTLHRKFGVLHLLDAFRQIDGEELRLVICGVGDSESEIKKACEQDSRISFKGQLSREEVLKLQRSATVLVNPRLNNEEFTKYSFPSKTMEYLASGVPTVAYMLDGIPKEYGNYIIYPENDTASALADTVKKVCMMSDNERKSLGGAGKEFVLENKNARIQCKRILDFLTV